MKLHYNIQQKIFLSKLNEKQREWEKTKRKDLRKRGIENKRLKFNEPTEISVFYFQIIKVKIYWNNINNNNII